MKNKIIGSKASLAVALSKLKVFNAQKVKLEQYATDSEIAATILWLAYMKGDIEGKIVADMGSGTGILGLGALLLGAKQVYFVEIDVEAMAIAKDNYNLIKSEYSLAGEAVFMLNDITEFDNDVEVVVENPPFGIKTEHSDRVFLEKAMTLSDKIYSLHKSESSKFMAAFSKDNGFKVSEELKMEFPLKASLDYHTKRIHRFGVTLFVIGRDLSSTNPK